MNSQSKYDELAETYSNQGSLLVYNMEPGAPGHYEDALAP